MNQPEAPSKAPESSKTEKVRRNRLWIWLTLTATILGGGAVAMQTPVRLNEKSEVRVPLINYLKYKLFVNQEPSEKAVPEKGAAEPDSPEQEPEEQKKTTPPRRHPDSRPGNLPPEEGEEAALV